MTPELLLLSVSLLAWGLGEGMFFYFQPLYLQQLGADPIAIGGILGAAGLAMTVAHIPAGWLADRIGRRPMLRISWIIGTSAGFLMAFARSLPVFVAGLLLYGITAAVIAPLNSYVTHARGKLSVARAITLNSAFYNVGAIAGPTLGGFIANRFGLPTTYLVSAIIFVVSTVLIFTLPGQPRTHHDPASPPENLLSNRRYITLTGIAFFAIFAMYLSQPLTPNYLQNENGLTIEQIGQIGTIASLGNVVFNLTLGSLQPRTGFLLGQLAVIGFNLLLWKGTSFGWFAAGYFMLGGFRVSRPMIIAQVRELIHGAQMGLAYGVTETVNALPAIIAPPLAGLIYDKNPGMIYPLAISLLFTSLVIGLRFIPHSSSPQPVPVMEKV